VSWMHGVAARLRLLFSRRSSELRFDSELQFHIDMEVERLVREQALEPDEARRRALASLGGIEAHREALRAGRDTVWLNGLALDLKLGFRMLAKYPGLTLVGVLGMSVAVTVGALAFTAVNAVTSKSLPVDEGDRIVAIRNVDAQNQDNAEATMLHDLETWRGSLTAVELVNAYRIVPANLVVGSAPPVSVLAAEMTASAFRVTRVQPVLGRYLMAEDEREGAPNVVVVGYDLWQSRLGGRTDAVGSSLQLGTTRYTVVGVMPQGYAFPIDNNLWIPMRLDPLRYERGKAPSINAFGRLAPGISLDEAQLQVTTIGQRLAATYPDTHRNIRPRISLYTRIFFDSPGISGFLHLGQIIVSLLLVVIGINVAVLVYARTASRTGEIAVRTALGANRRRIVMQLFAEALALSSVAALVGIVVAHFVFQRVESMIRLSADGGMPYWMQLRITPSVVLYVAGLAVLAAVIIGVIPGLKATRQSFAATIKASSGGASIRLGRSWTALLVTQVAVSVAALPIAIAATEGVIRTAFRDFSTPETESFVVATPLLSLEPGASPEAAQKARKIRYSARVADLARILREQPGGGADVVFMSHPPSGEDQIAIAADSLAAKSAADTSLHNARRYTAISRVESGFFPAFNIRLLAGRNFHSVDVAVERTVIVNRSFAQQVFAGGNALGRRIRKAPWGSDSIPGPWWEIVGVVDDFPPVWKGAGFVPGDIDDRAEPKVYLPFQPDSLYPITMAVRAQGVVPVAMSDRIRQLAMTVDPGLRFISIRTVKDVLDQEAQAERLGMLGIFMVALSVVLLSAAGIYALMSFTVSRSQREIGIRSALGASSGRVLTGILSRALKQVGLGIAIGTAGAGALSRLAGDSVSFSGLLLILLQVAALMGVVSVLATIGPARRALKVQPTDCLKAQ
jgi:putative ABC transport system permease protein